MKLNERIRWRIIRIIDKLRPHRYCWANLCIWATFGDTRLRDVETPHKCKKEAQTNEPHAACYCGRYISPQVSRDLPTSIRIRHKLGR